MQRSENITNLVKALNKFQSICPIVSKKSKNPYHYSTYASLAEIWEAIQKPLTECGLAISQPPSTTEDGKGTRVETVVFHAPTGEWIGETMTVFPRPEKPKPDERGQDQSPFVGPQALGSGITYARRYALCAFLGIVTDDDDGEGAEGRGNGQKRPARADDARTLKEAQQALTELDQATKAPDPAMERKGLLDAISGRMKALIREDDPKKSAKQKALMAEAFATDKWTAVIQLPLDQLKAGLDKIGGNGNGQTNGGPAADIGF